MSREELNHEERRTGAKAKALFGEPRLEPFQRAVELAAKRKHEGASAMKVAQAVRNNFLLCNHAPEDERLGRLVFVAHFLREQSN